MGGTLTVLHVPTISDPTDRLAAGRFGRGIQLMNSYGSTKLFGMLMATSLAAGASALEINQQRAPSTAGAPAFTLPAFLDVARLPDMQDAWRARFGNVSDDAAVQPAGEATTSTPEAVRDAAQWAMTRAAQASREAAAVRERAEELSRRFGAGGAESAADVVPVDVVNVPTATASINTDANPSDVAQPVEHLLAPADERAAHDSIDTWKNSTRVIEDMPAKPAKSANTKPAKPAKRSIASPPPRQPVQTAVQNGARAEKLLAVDFVELPPDSDPMLPREMRAFGWNAQP